MISVCQIVLYLVYCTKNSAYVLFNNTWTNFDFVNCFNWHSFVNLVQFFYCFCKKEIMLSVLQWINGMSWFEFCSKQLKCSQSSNLIANFVFACMLLNVYAVIISQFLQNNYHHICSSYATFWWHVLKYWYNLVYKMQVYPYLTFIF